MRAAAAAVCPNGFCAAFEGIMGRLQAVDMSHARLLTDIEMSFTDGQKPGSRTRAWVDMFGTG